MKTATRVTFFIFCYCLFLSSVALAYPVKYSFNGGVDVEINGALVQADEKVKGELILESEPLVLVNDDVSTVARWIVDSMSFCSNSLNWHGSGYLQLTSYQNEIFIINEPHITGYGTSSYFSSEMNLINTLPRYWANTDGTLMKVTIDQYLKLPDMIEPAVGYDEITNGKYKFILGYDKMISRNSSNTPVPEPTTIALLGAGFAGVFLLRKRNS